MKKRMLNLKKILSAAAIVAAAAGLFWGSHTSNAAEIAKSRGRVIVDLENFDLIESTSNDEYSYGLKPDNDQKSRYYLHYKNEFTDRNNLGCTYRSNNSFDMTDVIAIESYPNSQQESNDKVLLYVDPGSRTYYHRKHRDDVTNDLVKGSGWVRDLDSICVETYVTTPQRYSVNINPRYGYEYVYVGISHEWLLHNAKVYFDNRSIVSNTEGCINLKLKEHKITLLQPEPFTMINAKGEKEKINAYANLALGLENGKYEVGTTGSVYRDESVTLQYTLMDAELCNLKEIKFYSDKEKKNLLYTMDVSDKSNRSTFTFDSALIRKLEEKTGEFKLGALYLEPVFAARDVAFDFNSSVNDYVHVVSAGGNTYELREIETNALIGTIKKNAAKSVGDILVMNYEKNQSYDGEWRFECFEYRICSSSNQVNTATPVIQKHTDQTNDIEHKYKDTYFWVRVHVVEDVDIILQPKTMEYCNQYLEIDKATVMQKGEIIEVDDDMITYEYYTDESCDEKYLMDELPINAGNYFVKATLKADNTSRRGSATAVAPFTIIRAYPEIREIETEVLESGQSLKDCEIVRGAAYGVSGEVLTGDFSWVDDSIIPPVGNSTADVWFTPSSVYAINYRDARGTAPVTVARMTPNITMTDKTVVYSGMPVPMDTAKVTGENKEDTKQNLKYEYYPTPECNKKERSLTPPTDAGTYYVLVSAEENAKYSYAKTKIEDAAVLTITQREASLLQIPVSFMKETMDVSEALVDEADKKEYRVYIKDTIDVPEGTISLELLGDGEKLLETVEQDVNESNYALFEYDSIKHLIDGKEKVQVVAIYHEPEQKNNYKIEPNTYDLVINGEEVVFYRTERFQKKFTEYASSYSVMTQIWPDGAHQGDEAEVKWHYDENNDVAHIECDGTRIEVVPINVGTTIVKGVADVYTKGEGSSTVYLLEIIEITKGTTSIREIEEELLTYQYGEKEHDYQIHKEIYTGYPDKKYYYVPAPEAVITYQKDGVIYEEFPTDPGTYAMSITIPESRNYYEYVNTEYEITIAPYNPTITLNDQSFEYDGQAHGLKANVTGFAEGPEVTGKITYHYTGVDGTVYDSEEAPVDAGTYKVVARLTGDGVYSEATSNEAALTILPTDCTITASEKAVVYTGEQVEAEVDVIGINNQAIEPENLKIYYRNSMDPEGSHTTIAPTDAGIYYVWATKETQGNYKEAISNKALLTIKPADIDVVIEDEITFTYTGNVVTVNGDNTKVQVTDVKGMDITSGSEISYQFYKDAEGYVKIEAPVNAGNYYVQAQVADHKNYNAGESNIAKVLIEKAIPDVQVQAGDIEYGQECSESVISGTAIGVKEEVLEGSYILTGELVHQKKDAGTYEVEVLYEPKGEAGNNYVSVTKKTSLNVIKYQPTLSGANKTVIYNGEAVTLDEVKIAGAEGMPQPEGLAYTYYSDAALTAECTPLDAGTYYVKVSVPESANYKKVEEKYALTIEKAQGEIGLQLSGVDKAAKTLSFKGVIYGVFDNPTGTISFYKKPTNEPETAYEKVQEDIAIQESAEGTYTFAVDNVVIGEHDFYDFKAVYEEGSKQNYTIEDGLIEELDLSRKLRPISFEHDVYTAYYGDKDFQILAKEDNTGNSDGIIYHRVERAGNPEIIEVSDAGIVKVNDVGTAYAYAVKPKDSEYYIGLAIAKIEILKAPVKLSLKDKTVVYSGHEVEIDPAEVTSKGDGFEDLTITYRYVNAETGETTNGLPVNVGTYKVTATSKENNHYQASKSNEATLIIEQAEVIVQGEDYETTYSGKIVEHPNAAATGNTGETFTKEELQFSYFYDEVCKEAVPDSEQGVVDAGTYYCKVSFPGNDNYKEAEAVFNVTVRKVNASILLQASVTDSEKHIAEVKGTLDGVFDDPTGTIKLLVKESGLFSFSDYEEIVDDIEIVEEDGIYVFSAIVTLEDYGTYDFKAEYVIGVKDNYEIEEDTVKCVKLEEPKDDPIDPDDPTNPDDDSERPGEIPEDSEDDIVKTNDTNNIMLYLALAFVSLMSIIVIGKREWR